MFSYLLYHYYRCKCNDCQHLDLAELMLYFKRFTLKIFIEIVNN